MKASEEKAMKASEFLKKAMRLISKPYGWGQHRWANIVRVKDRKIIKQYCLEGALQHVFNEEVYTKYLNLTHYTDMDKIYNKVRRVLREKCGTKNLVRYNDAEDRTKKEVLAIMKAAIVDLEEKGL
jgi:hypothetical protein